MEWNQLAPLPQHEILAQAAWASCAGWSWNQFPPLNLCQGPAVTQGRCILGWSAWVPREGIILTGWTRFLPIPAFQWRSYFWVMLYEAPGTAERNTTWLEERGAWHIWHCMRSCSQGAKPLVFYIYSAFWLENKSNFVGVILFPVSKNRAASQPLKHQSPTKPSLIIRLHYKPPILL